MRLKQKKEDTVPKEIIEEYSENRKESNLPIPEPLPEKKLETKLADSDLRKKAEKVLEDILLGNLKPSRGMKISLSFKGPFTLLGAETTAESSFEYNYPDGSNEETPKHEDPVLEKPLEKPQPKEAEVKRLF